MNTPVVRPSGPVGIGRADRLLVARFAIATVVAFVAVNVLVGWLVERQVRDEYERFATFHAVFVRDAVIAPELGPDGPLAPMGGPDLDHVLQVIEERVLDRTVRRVRVWSPDGRVLLSDDRDTIGRRFPEVLPHLAADTMDPVSRVTDLGDAWMVGDRELVERAFVTFLPLTADLGGGGAVLEVIQDDAPTQAAVGRFSDALDLTRAAGLGLAFLLVMPIAVGASRRLRRQASSLERQADELSRLLATEQDASKRLRELDRMKNTFLTAVSHELRTPLTVVRGLAATLVARDEQLEPAQRRDLLGRVDAHAQRLDTLLRDLLDVDHLTRGVVTVRRTPTDLRALVLRAVDNVDRRDHRIMVDVPAVTVAIDPAQVERIVENLVANAVRHTPAGCRVDVQVVTVGDWAEVIVEDDGPGIAPALRETIFEPFVQGPIVDDHAPGTGVGLSLVARFAHLHGGRAWVETSLAGGAAFHVLLGTEEPAAETTSREGRDRVGQLR